MSTRQRHWLWGGASHPGAREEQQDRWGVFTQPDGYGVLAVVADGMGGHRDGAVAAQSVLDTAAEFVREQAALLRERPNEALALLCQQAHTHLTAVSKVAHTTIVALWLHDDGANWVHVGDSRLYHFRAGQRLLRTRDHSAAQMLVALGEISEAEIGAHPDSNLLYRSLGSEEAPKPETGQGQTAHDDVFALCSDGVWHEIEEAEIWAAAQTSHLNAAATRLVARAVSRAGARADNATLVLLRRAGQGFREWPWLRRWLTKSS